MNDHKIALKEAKGKLEKNQQQIAEIGDRIKNLNKQISEAMERVEVAQTKKEQAYEQFILGDISEQKRDVVVTDLSLAVDDASTLKETLAASGRVLSKLNGQSTDLGRAVTAASQRLWRAIAEDYKKEIVELVGDKVAAYQSAVLAFTPNAIPYSIVTTLFPAPAAVRVKEVQADIQSQVGF